MARVYQKSDIDLKALSMKKWFNTNYHYVVPEIDDKIKFEFNPVKMMDELNLSSGAGIRTKPVMIGPYTFLKLSKIDGKTDDYIEPVLKNYMKLLEVIRQNDVEWLQIDEPALVMDMNAGDRKMFQDIYGQLLKNKGKLKVLLQTYFGDVRDIYEFLIASDFDALGLDFIEGTTNLDLLRKNGYHSGKLLFVGIVNGRNIWINDYEKSLSTLSEISKHVSLDRIVLSTSCSLLHVPYSLKNEIRMKPEVREHLAFAEEKLVELTDLSDMFEDDRFASSSLYKKNVQLMGSKGNVAGYGSNDARLYEIDPAHFQRKSKYADRKTKQVAKFKLPPFPTTTIGSFPQDKELRQKRSSFNKGRISGDDYESYLKIRIDGIIKFQEDIGLDVLVHGEFERNDMVEYFGEKLSGFVFTENGWVQSYGVRGVKPPIIFGDVKRPSPMTPAWINYAQSLTKKPVKGMLTGPVTIYNWSFPREDKSAKEVVYQIALAIREEVADLEKSGVGIIQIDEAALREKLPLRRNEWHEKYLDWAVKAFRLASSSVKDETQIHTHMCYSDFTDIMDAIKELDADVITIEAAKSDLDILRSLKENNYDHGIGPGVYDIHSPRVPSVLEISSLLDKMTGYIRPEDLWINPDCGLKTRGMEETVDSLKNMILAAKKMREKYFS
jgi:5-methyltetrahydropteroyltriglutamate--homocysteine methyltransferase